MSLIKSISGIRGTIGGNPGDGLGGIDIVKFASAYAEYIKRSNDGKTGKIVVGRDARLSGCMVLHLVKGALMAMGFDVIDIGLATTPTTELAVTGEGAIGGIIITASHNPIQWNALKLLDHNGEFLTDSAGKEVIRIAEAEDFRYADVLELGQEYTDDTWGIRHIEMVKSLKLVDTEAIRAANFTVAVDAVNSVGGKIIPELLRSLGVKNIVELNCEPTGRFAHTPEPIPENLTQISDLMKEGKADVGFVVDPDVDRLAIVMENGEMFVEEYTLVAVADYVLSHTPGSTVSNLSSSRALRDVTHRHDCEYNAAAVGEVNVVAKMKETYAVIGGEGNGGVIYPELHYGRDALVGVALFLTLLAKSGKKVSDLKKDYPQYQIAKNKIQLTPDIDVDAILEGVKRQFADYDITDIDGVKIDFPDSWVHLRKSNTEPIIRIYSEASTMAEADALADRIRETIKTISGPRS
ncbi:MAG: phosphoglucosamine mutase [Muribaculaceae bacterium]|nr:phosphoglucosamine mutase [Muribaculaceae bacterium]